jgi:hypothetical protein
VLCAPEMLVWKYMELICWELFWIFENRRLMKQQGLIPSLVNSSLMGLWREWAECLQTRENRRKEMENEKMMVNKHKSSVKTSDFRHGDLVRVWGPGQDPTSKKERDDRVWLFNFWILFGSQCFVFSFIYVWGRKWLCSWECPF